MSEQKYDLYINGDIEAENMSLQTAIVLLKALFETYYAETADCMEITVMGRKQKDADGA